MQNAYLRQLGRSERHGRVLTGLACAREQPSESSMVLVLAKAVARGEWPWRISGRPGNRGPAGSKAAGTRMAGCSLAYHSGRAADPSGLRLHVGLQVGDPDCLDEVVLSLQPTDGFLAMSRKIFEQFAS